MLLTKEEIKVSVYALVIDPAGKQQAYGLDKLAIASEMFRSFNTCIEDDESKSYKDGEVELSTPMKAFLLERLNREWGVADGQHVLSLKEKLEAA